ncbi:unnamed protein product [Rhizopus stolonifer]
MITSVNRSIIYQQDIQSVIEKKKETDLPPTYATLPTSIKLEEEHNVFDESFEGATKITPLPPEKCKKFETKDDLKRKKFLERNRIAALKCRQRKKQWLENLQTKVEYLTADNEQYQLEANALRQELFRLQQLLLAHKNCPINQQSF